MHSVYPQMKTLIPLRKYSSVYVKKKQPSLKETASILKSIGI